jgi:glucose/arabinose dehydrogenase
VAIVSAAAIAGAESPALSVAPDVRIEVVAAGLGAPRGMAVDSSGALLVSIPGEGRIVALVPAGGRGPTRDVATVVSQLDRPHGLAFWRGHLYVAETRRIVRYRYDAATRAARDAVVIVSDLPAGTHHWTRSIAFTPGGQLFVAIGSSCDVCREADPRRAAIVRYNTDGSGEHLFATGLRNPVGLAFHPTTGQLWTTVNERDWPRDGAPPDLLTEVQAGAAYGWPHCYAWRRMFSVDPEFPGASCRNLTLPTIELPPHSAPLGHSFYTGGELPPRFRGNLFVALHGSRPQLAPAGYKVVRVVFEGGTPVRVEDFITGWRVGDRIWGRPVDIVTGLDGALYISDDHGGKIYRVTTRQ